MCIRDRDDLCSLAFIFQGAFFRHDRTYDKFDAQKQCHEDGEVSHSGARQQGCNIASHQGKGQDREEHDDTMAYIQVSVFFIGIGRDCRCQYIRRQGDSHSLIGIKVQELSLIHI